MRKAEVQMTLKKGADEVSPNPVIPPKRSKVSAEQVLETRVPGRPTPTPPVFIRKMRNAAVGTGCDIRLKVTVSGDPQPSLYWYHNEYLLNMENQEYGGFWIRDCKPSDAGLYTCIANNHLGEARSSAVLAVLDLGEGNSCNLVYVVYKSVRDSCYPTLHTNIQTQVLSNRKKKNKKKITPSIYNKCLLY